MHRTFHDYFEVLDACKWNLIFAIGISSLLYQSLKSVFSSYSNTCNFECFQNNIGLRRRQIQYEKVP